MSFHNYYYIIKCEKHKKKLKEKEILLCSFSQNIINCNNIFLFFNLIYFLLTGIEISTGHDKGMDQWT